MSHENATTTLKATFKSQYHAGLAMRRQAIERCPDETWYSREPTNTFWQIAYHTLFFTHLYRQPDEASFRPWKGHQAAVQHQDGIAGKPDPRSPLPLIPNPYSKGEALEYCNVCDQMVAPAVDALDLWNPDCGFWWYKVSKLEHQMINIRHLQHGVAQLAERLRAASNVGIDWVGARRPGNG